MILTLTLNPSLDRTIQVDYLARGETLRAANGRVDPGGKGVNVSRAMLANGLESRAVLPCGGDEGLHLLRLLQAEGVDLLAVPISGHTRSNVTLAEPDGTVTKINEPGPALTPAEFEAITDRVLAASAEAEWVVACGSLPPGLPENAFAQLCERLVDAGVQVAVDTSGPGLRAAAEAGVALVKPNREELAEVVAAPLDSMAAVIAAAQQLRSWGAGTVLASLGADGAVLVDAHGVVTGESPVDQPRSSVGAGDALLAGFLAAGAVGSSALAEALAWAAAAVSLPGSRMPGPDDLRRHNVRIHPPHSYRPAAAVHPLDTFAQPGPVRSTPEPDDAPALPQG